MFCMHRMRIDLLAAEGFTTRIASGGQKRGSALDVLRIEFPAVVGLTIGVSPCASFVLWDELWPYWRSNPASDNTHG
jgi:hypothetical protein